MSKFNYNDKVAFYAAGRRLTGTVILRSPLTIQSDDKGSGNFIVHPKQCRKLVRKERQRVWVNLNDSWFVPNGIGHVAVKEKPDKIGYTEFIEVRKKKGKST